MVSAINKRRAKFVSATIDTSSIGMAVRACHFEHFPLLCLQYLFLSDEENDMALHDMVKWSPQNAHYVCSSLSSSSTH